MQGRQDDLRIILQEKHSACKIREIKYSTKVRKQGLLAGYKKPLKAMRDLLQWEQLHFTILVSFFYLLDLK